MTKALSILAIVFTISVGFTGRPGTSGKWVVEKTSSLAIQGETNVNSFRCEVTEYLHADTLFYAANESSKKLMFVNSRLRIDIKRFDCHSKLITNDFRSALKADENPALTITFVSLDQFNNPCDNQSVKGIVDIGLANVAKRTEICYVIKTLPGGRVELNGSHVFTFSDFNLKAPRKLAGLIRTKNEIKVNFRLFFRAV